MIKLSKVYSKYTGASGKKSFPCHFPYTCGNRSLVGHVLACHRIHQNEVFLIYLVIQNCKTWIIFECFCAQMNMSKQVSGACRVVPKQSLLIPSNPRQSQALPENFLRKLPKNINSASPFSPMKFLQLFCAVIGRHMHLISLWYGSLSILLWSLRCSCPWCSPLVG